MIGIHNGSDEPAEFSVSYRVSDNLTEGYEPAPADAENWVTVAEPAPVLAAKETREVLIVLEMPDDAQAPARRCEFSPIFAGDFEFCSGSDFREIGMVYVDLEHGVAVADILWRLRLKKYRRDLPAAYYGYDCDANAIWLPVVLQWNFFLTDVISVFGEPGFAIERVWWDTDYCDGPGCEGSDTDLEPVFWGGGRFLVGDSVSIVARIGMPYVSAGVSFLL